MKPSLTPIPGLIAVLAVTNATAAATAASSPATPLRLEISTQPGLATLRWSGGEPRFQLQTRSSPADAWRNLGEPTEARSAQVPLTRETAFFRVVGDYTARFEILFDATWSQLTHPTAWPPNAHWSGPVGGVHNDNVHFWREGEPASEGIRLMAERGQQATLAAEIADAIPSGNALFTLTAGGIGSPAQRRISFPQATTRDFSRLTLCSMIAPSPDWFVGVANLPLVGEDGNWIREQTVTLFGFDAGTDSGADFTSPDLVTQPRGVVTRFTGYPALINGSIVPFGNLVVRRTE